MKKPYLYAAAVWGASLMLMACGGGQPAAEEPAQDAEAPMTEAIEKTMNINTENSVVMWTGEMMGMYAHEGTVNFTSGSIMVKGDEVTGGNFEVAMNSMVATDENFKPEEGSTKEKLIAHLSGEEFFSVDSFPSAAFEITSVSGNTAMGMLTVRGIQNEESVENIMVSSENGATTVTGTLTFDRKKYEVSFDHPVQEMVLSDDIVLNIELRATE